MKMHPAMLWRRNSERRRYLGIFGKVIGFSVVYQGPLQLEKRTPYVVALIEVGDERVVSQLVDCDPLQVTVGSRVVGVMRKLFDVDADALIVYGVKFSLVEDKI